VRTAGRDRVLIEVADNGVGISPQVRGRIFEPFFTTKPVGIGTGLGLAICHGVVTSLGGTLDVDSEVGRGSVFRVELPAASRPEAPASGKQAPSVPPTRSTRGRILVVDDEPIVCFSLQRLLATEGDVVAVTSAKEALERIQNGERFDVILCDLMMPDMDGQTLHAALARLAPQQAERMVFVTGGAFTMRARDFLERVPNPRLGKPFDMDALFAVVRSFVA
jgi:CheY-like chemotaxis protein